MAKDDEGLLARGKRYLKERAAKRGKEMADKAAADEAKKAKAPSSDTGGTGGYGGAGDAARKREIERQTEGVSFKSSNGGQTGRSTATERRARDKRLGGMSI